ncbi:MAG: tyrosine-type recombinase/integrase [Stygiobacter sp.]
MASIYKKNNTIYISWYDPFLGKNKNKSTGLIYNKLNMKKAKLMAVEFQKSIDIEVNKRNQLGIKRNSIEKTIDHFLQINSNKNPKTIYEYNRFFKLFTEKFNVKDPATLINKNSCEEWLISLSKYNYQSNALYAYNKVLKKYLNFLFEYNYIPMFRLNKDVVYKQEVKDIIVFTPEDLNLLMNNLDQKNENFKVTFYLLLYTGLRPSDIYNICGKDVDLKNRTIKYYSEKTKQYFYVPFHRKLKPIMQERINQVGDSNLIKYETIGNIGKAFRRYLKMLNLDKKGYNLRTFRKTFITLAHQNDIDLATVAKIVGHKKITTTEKYYNRLSILKQANELKKLKF